MFILFSWLIIIFCKRYFVLAESHTNFCQLRVFTKAVEASWGTVPLDLRTTIPITAIESIDVIASNGFYFKIKYISTEVIKEKENSNYVATGSNNGSVYSDSDNGSAKSDWIKSKETILQAPDAQVTISLLAFAIIIDAKSEI